MTETAVEIGLSLMVDEAFDEEKVCEHTYHNNVRQQKWHEGSAKWYARSMCVRCGYVCELKSFCDKWIQHLSNKGLVLCVGCGSGAETVFLLKEKINA